MKYLLTSNGVTNASIRAALDGMLVRPLAECTALVIPTAAYWFDSGPDIAYRLIRGTAHGALGELGWKSVGVLELTALPSLAEQVWAPRVRQTDVLLVGGGDPMYLCRWMRESGFADLLPTLRDETVYVGVSAGSMAVTASFGEHYNDRPVPTTGSETPLGLVDIALFPHLDHPELADNSQQSAQRWSAGVPVPAYAVDDDTAVVVVDDRVEVVSGGHWEVFPA